MTSGIRINPFFSPSAPRNFYGRQGVLVADPPQADWQAQTPPGLGKSRAKTVWCARQRWCGTAKEESRCHPILTPLNLFLSLQSQSYAEASTRHSIAGIHAPHDSGFLLGQKPGSGICQRSSLWHRRIRQRATGRGRLRKAWTTSPSQACPSLRFWSCDDGIAE